MIGINETPKSFTYTYSARQNSEILAIRKKYLITDEEKMATLLQLDKSVSKRAAVAGIGIGTLGCLMLSSGLYLSLDKGGSWLILNVLCSMLGALVMLSAPFVHTWTTEKEQRRIAPRVLAIANELLTEQR